MLFHFVIMMMQTGLLASVKGIEHSVGHNPMKLVLSTARTEKYRVVLAILRRQAAHTLS